MVKFFKKTQIFKSVGWYNLSLQEPSKSPPSNYSVHFEMTQDVLKN